MTNNSGQGPDYRAVVLKNARAFKVPEDLADALIRQESGYDPYAVSSAGAMGLGQLMWSTARHLGVTDPFDPEQNARGAMKYLGQLLRKFKHERLAVAAYNAGPTAVARFNGVPPYKETAGYVAKIEKRMKREYRPWAE